jgi:hypothetical protein
MPQWMVVGTPCSRTGVTADGHREILGLQTDPRTNNLPVSNCGARSSRASTA